MSDLPTYRERLDARIWEPETLETILRHVANGGTLVTLAELWALSFGDLSAWLSGDADRLKRYQAALRDRDERTKEVVLHEVRMMATVRLYDVFNLDGSVKNPAEWPEPARAAVKSVEYGVAPRLKEKTADGEWKYGPAPIVKVTFHDKKQAAELLGKNLALFVERHEVEGKFNLDEFLKQMEQLTVTARPAGLPAHDPGRIIEGGT